MHPMTSWIKRAKAIALRTSTDIAFCPTHMREAKPSIDPPNKRAVHRAASLGVSPYKLKTQRGKREHDPQKKIAKKMLMVKKYCNLVDPPSKD